MWFFLISSIASSIIGSAADSWFADTKLGRWFYQKVDDVASWASKKSITPFGTIGIPAALRCCIICARDAAIL